MGKFLGLSQKPVLHTGSNSEGVRRMTEIRGQNSSDFRLGWIYDNLNRQTRSQSLFTCFVG